MYFGNRHTATLEATMFRAFACVHCGHESVAKVRTKGEGQGVSPYMLREEGAREAASEEAHQKAAENADVLAAMATCPRCGKRDEGKVSSLRSWAYGKGVLFAALICAICWFLSGGRHDGFFIFGGLIGAPIALVATVMGDSWKWNEVDQRVDVLGHAEVERLLAKVKRAA